MRSTSPLVAVLAGALVAFCLHLVLGWGWTIVGGALAGFLVSRRAPAWGALAVLLSWAVLVVWNYATHLDTMQRMASSVAGLLGGLPGIVTPLLTVGLGALLGGLGGWAGGSVRGVIAAKDPART